jgi:DNA-binding transcriptional MerR regulator
MRISDLSRQADVPIATIKFYLRERLLPPGTSTGPNQASYGDVHLRRLGLIRILTGIGKLDLTCIHTLIVATEDDSLALTDLYDVVHRARAPEAPPETETDAFRHARADVDRFIANLGWDIESDAPARTRLTHILAALQRLGYDCTADFFAPYAEACALLAVQELNLQSPAGITTDRTAAMARTVLLEAALTATRQMAQKNFVNVRFGPDETGI